MEKLADGLQKLSEDDLLHVVTMVHDNKTSETYTKNDVESKLTSMPVEEMLTMRQMASSTSISTRCLTHWLRCCGTSRLRRPTYRSSRYPGHLGPVREHNIDLPIC